MIQFTDAHFDTSPDHKGFEIESIHHHSLFPKSQFLSQRSNVVPTKFQVYGTL